MTDDDEIPLVDALELARIEREAELASVERRIQRALAAARKVRGTPQGLDREWRSQLLAAKDGTPKASPGNVLKVLEHDEDFAGAIVRDNFRAKWVWVRQPPGHFDGAFPRDMVESDVSYLSAWVETVHGFSPGLDLLGVQLGAYAARHSVDALRDWVLSLQWDGRERIDTWLSACCGVPDSPYARAAGRRWLISAAARALMPGCKADLMLVLEGAQGKRKSSILQVLGGEWYTDGMPLHVDDKDAVLALAGHWIVEFGELDRYGRQDQSTVKDFISRRIDKIRPPYGKMVEPWPRRAVFAGTTNDDAYLLDATGGRRFLPVRVVGEVRLDRLRRCRELLFAEAIHWLKVWQSAAGDERSEDFRRGQWWLTKEEEALQVAEVDERFMVDPWEERLASWVHGRDYVTTAEAFERLGVDHSRATPHDGKRLGRALRRLGFGDRRQVRVGGVREWRYFTQSTERLSPMSPRPVNTVVTENPRNITAVTSVTDVTKDFSTYAHARARNETHTFTGDTGDNGESSAKICHHSKDGHGDTGDSVCGIQTTLDDLWGPK